MRRRAVIFGAEYFITLTTTDILCPPPILRFVSEKEPLKRKSVVDLAFAPPPPPPLKLSKDVQENIVIMNVTIFVFSLRNQLKGYIFSVVLQEAKKIQNVLKSTL